MVKAKRLTDPDLIAKVRCCAYEHYAQAAPDLPKFGQGHWHAAHDHAYDRVHDDVPEARAFNLKPHINAELARWVADDRYEARLWEAREKRREAARHKPPRKPKTPKVKRWDDRAPPPRSKRGIGSY